MAIRVVDHRAYARGGAVEALKADDVFAAWFGAGARIYGREVPGKPTWPFARVETPDVEPFETSGVVGGAFPLNVHIFDKGEGASERIDAMARRCGAVLDGAKLNLQLDAGETGEKPHTVGLEWQRSPVLRDSEASDAYHASVEFAATTAVQR